MLNPTCFAKERKRAASASVGLDGRMSRHRTAMARTESKTRSQFVNGVEQELHERAPKWTVLVDTAAAVQMDWMD